MRAVVQRVTKASVSVEGREISHIDDGMLVLIGVGQTDTAGDVQYIADKLAGLRIFTDSAGKMNLSLSEINGSVLAVSQFTLYGDARKGRRPSFSEAAPPENAQRLYEDLTEALKARGLAVKTGVFGADMQISLVNDGPVTILLDSSKLF